MTPTMNPPDHDGSITIRRVVNQFFVTVTLANGYSQVRRCDSEHEARIWADGLLDGMRIVRNLIANGPRLHTTIEGDGK